MKITYIFYYYWSADRRPCPAKGLLDNGSLVGGNNRIKGAEWGITEEDFLNTSLTVLTEKFPWPFGEAENA